MAEDGLPSISPPSTALFPPGRHPPPPSSHPPAPIPPIRGARGPTRGGPTRSHPEPGRDPPQRRRVLWVRPTGGEAAASPPDLVGGSGTSVTYDRDTAIFDRIWPFFVAPLRPPLRDPNYRFLAISTMR